MLAAQPIPRYPGMGSTAFHAPVPMDDPVNSVSPSLQSALGFSGEVLGSRSLAPLLHQGPLGSPAEQALMSHVKGDLTEHLAGKLLAHGFFEESGPWIGITPHRTGNAGIDGLMVRVRRNGRMELMVVESKYGSSKLGKPKIGAQMGRAWTSKHLADTAKDYQRLSEFGKGKRLVRASTWSRKHAEGVLRVPLRDGKYADMWRSGDKLCFNSNDPDVANHQIKRKLEQVGARLGDAAAGRHHYRARVFRLEAVGKNHRVILQKIDPDTLNLTTTRIEEGQFDKLPKDIQKMLRSTFEKHFRALGWSKESSEKMADRACKDAQYFKEMSKHPRWSPWAGVDRYLLYTSVGSALAAFAVDAFMQQLTTGRIDWKRSAGLGLVGGVAGGVGYYVGIQVHAFLVTTEIGRTLVETLPTKYLTDKSAAVVAGGLASGLVASAILAYGAYLMGYSDLRAANRQMIAGGAAILGGAGFTSGAMALAIAVGHASTGTAISTLGGAAATNAAMAWLGGGAASVGGFGMAGGAVVLSGGAAVAAVAIGAGVGVVFKHMDRVEQRRVLEGRLELVTQQVERGVLGSGNAGCLRH